MQYSRRSTSQSVTQPRGQRRTAKSSSLVVGPQPDPSHWIEYRRQPSTLPNPSGNAGIRRSTQSKTLHGAAPNRLPATYPQRVLGLFCRPDSLFVRDSEMSQEGSPSSDLGSMDQGSMTIYPFVSQNCVEPCPGSPTLRALVS